MQDLSIIRKQNAQATEASIAPAVAAGKYVVERREGLHFFGHTEHDTLGEAQAKIDEINAENQPGVTVKVHLPDGTVSAA